MAKTRKRTKGSSSAEIDRLFADGEPAEKFSNLPTGTYDGIIKPGSAVIEPKRDASHQYRASLSLVVTEPEEFKDRTQLARYDLSTQIGVNIFLAELATLDVGQPKNLKEAAEMMEETDNLPVRFWVSEPQDEFPPKVRINERLEGNGNDGGSSSGGDDNPFDIGDRVTAAIDDEDYPGEVISIVSNDTVEVKFDDGDVQDCDIGDVEDEKAGKAPEYTADEINDMDESDLTELAKENDMDPDDHDTWEDLAAALIDELGL